MLIFFQIHLIYKTLFICIVYLLIYILYFYLSVIVLYGAYKNFPHIIHLEKQIRYHEKFPSN